MSKRKDTTAPPPKDKALTPEEREELFTVAGTLIALADEKIFLRDSIRAQHAEEYARLDEIEKDMVANRLRTEELLRKGDASITISGFNFSVTPKTSLEVRTQELVATARERGDLSTLLDLGLLSYSVSAEQLERLPGTLKVVYGEFIERKKATSAVTLPKTLK